MNAGHRRILLQSPTGGGKTVIMFALVKWGFPCVFYLHRQGLFDEFAERLTEAGVAFGLRAAGHSPRLIEEVQLAMIQTDHARGINGKKWELHKARIVFVDEAHDQKAGMAQDIFRHYETTDAIIVGVTATPCDLGGLYDVLVTAGNNTELRHCGALLPATTYAPNEPDAPKLLENESGRFTEGEVEQACRKIVTGNIIEHWRKLNPNALPTIGCAASVPTSIGHAKEFKAQGIKAAHIDGKDTWIDGEWHDTTSDVRRQLREEVKSGRIKVVWNRFVLREGIDWPFVGHGIFATIFSSLVSYLQAGGRILRNCDGLDRVTIQDHGGNWWRYGSLNSDRVWSLGDTARILTSLKAKRHREKKDPEPITCPKCYAVRTWGRACPECGHQSRRRPRYLQQSDGQLREVCGDIYTPRERTTKPTDVEKWRSMYYRAKTAGMTFAQAEALFAKENGWIYPSQQFPGMPVEDRDLYNRVCDVPVSQLTAPFARIQQQEEAKCPV